jgi:hypothetical protein
VAATAVGGAGAALEAAVMPFFETAVMPVAIAAAAAFAGAAVAAVAIAAAAAAAVPSLRWGVDKLVGWQAGRLSIHLNPSQEGEWGRITAE